MSWLGGNFVWTMMYAHGLHSTVWDSEVDCPASPGACPWSVISDIRRLYCLGVSTHPVSALWNWLSDINRCMFMRTRKRGGILTWVKRDWIKMAWCLMVLCTCDQWNLDEKPVDLPFVALNIWIFPRIVWHKTLFVRLFFRYFMWSGQFHSFLLVARPNHSLSLFNFVRIDIDFLKN